MTELVLEKAIDLSQLLNKAAETKAKQLPVPKGYKILVTLPEAEEQYDNGLVKASSTMHYETVLSNVLFVVELGDLCYKDETRFPTGPWCKKGDFVMCRANTGTRFNIHGREFRLINDDSIEAVVEDPRGIGRVN
jgi:co-chaperonin GroES (HSP10)